MNEYMSDAEKIFAEIPHLGESENQKMGMTVRTDPLWRIIETASVWIEEQVRGRLEEKALAAQVQEAAEQAQRKLHQMELAVLRAGEGAMKIARERARQQIEKGYGPDHDRRHTDGELISAAIAYAEISLPGVDWQEATRFPWQSHYKPSQDRIRNLERAGAFIAAEIDRLKDESRNKFDSPRRVKDNPQA